MKKKTYKKNLFSQATFIQDNEDTSLCTVLSVRLTLYMQTALNDRIAVLNMTATRNDNDEYLEYSYQLIDARGISNADLIRRAIQEFDELRGKFKSPNDGEPL